jgi:ATP phosphoribosyltransferase
MENTTLIIGMPAGSLANPNRGGNLVKLLETAGFKTSGYENGGPSLFKTINYLYGWDGGPQEFGTQLGLDEIDVAIAGDDWIMERLLELKYEYNTQIDLKKMLSLKRGNVRIVSIIEDDKTDSIQSFLEKNASADIITIVTEMPYLSLDWIRKKLDEIGLLKKFNDYSVQKYKTPAKITNGVVIYETWGKTEAKVKNGGADLGVEITQSGSAIRNYGLTVIDEVFQSETGIYINPSVAKNQQKKELLDMFLINMYGAVNAEKKVMIVFNIPNNKTSAVEQYLKKHNLFADEPTINRGKEFTEYSVQVDISDTSTPLARVRFDLAKLDAKNINTIPIDSSIPGIEVIQ